MTHLSTLKRYVDFVHPTHVNKMSFKRPRPFLCVSCPSKGIELMMRVRLGCLCVHERTRRYSRSNEVVESEVIDIAPCPACGNPSESLSHFMFDCPRTAGLRTELFDSLKLVPDGAEKLRQCLTMVDGKEKVSCLVSCRFWGATVARSVTPAIAGFFT